MKPVWHIYYATKGTAGAYIDALLDASAQAHISAHAFVSCDYRYSGNNITRCFFPYTDFTNRRNGPIKLLRGMELALAYVFILLRALISRPAVNLNLVDDLYITYLFFRICRAAGLTVFVTCHDVVPQYSGMSKIRIEILNGADGLIVHSQSAAELLKNHLGEKARRKIVSYPFPFSSYERILSSSNSNTDNLSATVKSREGILLFLGVVRMSKGIETLLDAWRLCQAKNHHRLLIAGKWVDPPSSLKRLAWDLHNCTVVDKYLDDEEFVSLIGDAKFVVLPYRDYSHSSVILSCANHGGAVITSDIELFREILPGYDLSFPPGDSRALAKIIDYAMDLPQEKVDEHKSILSASVEKMNKDLVRGLEIAFQKMESVTR